ncbi:endonuclease [Chryseobacterium taklimakanense]|uniref:T9SS C-terminal target domain-containing protein n=1 Tax=Chryseobacterium taklimakanense TaxID=536441 RepID=A0A3G8WRU5_9FLAO|nr:endonuclease [Chryseobacterium taklimakanense]AZI20894.1 T9SS C-terminal target domain-containing protein [Chryseobacterium taklimakanense]
MKKLSFLILIFLSQIILAQAPANYYDGTAGLTGAALKTKLSQIISNGHIDKGYGGLYTGYETTDRDNFFEKDGTVLDMYSENPNGPDPYNYTPGQKQCGNYSNESDCYNREHIVPQSLFSKNYPMRSDINFIRPTDGKVNGMRSDYPFGMVSKPTFTSRNGSKVGNNTTSGYSGTVFEPIDTFKGDIARMVFYFVTRYESRMADFSTGNMLANNTYPSLQDWELQVLLTWAAQDPVSPEEIARNNASYNFQGNRNPYIDHPEWVQAVWGTTSSDTQAPTAPANLAVNSTTASTATLSWAAATDNIGVASYEIYVDGILKTTVSGSVTSATVTGLAANTTYSFYIIAKDAAVNASPASNTVQGTTLPANAGTSCANEDFENIPPNDSSYSTRTWTNKGISWTATDARTDERLNNRAIVIRNGSLTGSAVPNGIGSLTVTTQLKFSGSEGTFDLFVNGVKKGVVPYAASGKLTTTISDINIEGNVTVSLVNTSTSNRVALDDLSWTCYSSTLGLGETNVGSKKLTVSPNPVKNGMIQISGLEESNVRAEIYNMTGQLVQTVDKVSKTSDRIQLKNLPKGIYILKAGNQAAKFIIE